MASEHLHESHCCHGHSCDTALSEAAVHSLIEDIVSRLRSRGMRRTKAFDALLHHLATHHHPATLAELQTCPGLEGVDQVTVYRLVMKLEELGVVRRLGLHDRASYFLLNAPGHHHDYLVCTQCGAIQDIDLACPVEALESQIAQQTGFRGLYHELEFFGICPKCAATPA